MNTYTKFCPNVFAAKCTQEHQKGDVIIITTKYGQEHENEIHNFLGKTREGFYLYSVTRCDGMNAQERARRKAERLQGYQANAEKRSTQAYEASQEGRDFLRLAEPIKVGHHSEKRHRALIQRNWDRMGKSVAEQEKANEYARRAEFWEKKASSVNLSMPESLEFFEFKLEEAKKHHQNLKDNPSERRHSMSLQYANKAVKDAETNLNLAVKLWGSAEEVNQIAEEQKTKAEAKAEKTTKAEQKLAELKKEFGFFFAFSNEQLKEGVNKLREDGYLQEGEKVVHIKAGLYTPHKTYKEFIEKW